MHMSICLCGIINKLTYYICWKDKQFANLQLREGKKPTQEQRANDSFGKGFDLVKGSTC